MEEKGRFPAKTDSVRFSIGYVYDEFMKNRQRRVSTSKLYDYAFRLFLSLSVLTLYLSMKLTQRCY